MASSQHVLVVARHAKAEQGGAVDHDRELTDRGRADAAEAGGWLAGRGITPDRALVSAAPRAAQTWAALAEGAGWDLPPDLDRGLYGADPDTVLDVVRGLDESCACAVVVGHNPTMEIVAQLLDDGEGDDAATRDMASGFPTSAVAVFVVEGSWAELTTARLTGFHVGRG